MTDPVQSSTAYRLLSPHGFIEDVHGKGVFHWEAGEIVTRPATVELLRARGADMELVDERQHHAE